ncbi:MAG TPA: cytochrome c oxidase subunit II [Acidobacteriaceae bacterium]|jgi:cytochrome c oxidase subunit 2|nr:cytochrome c oxidase subunit II [Acidobacteriaceae bacterium]
MQHFISPVLWQFLIKWLTNFAIFPPEASTIAPYADALYFFLIFISVIGLAAVAILVVTFSIRYRQERNPHATQIEGSTLLEATWTIIPLILFMICFVWGALLYFRIYSPPANAMNIYVVGKQWMWKAEHPTGQHEINALHIPVGRPIQLTLISQDVFHSFSVPAFRVKREVIPGRYNTVWFEATKPGVYHLFCTQYCGTLHSQMIGWVYAMTPEDYQAWAAGSTSGHSLAQSGERLFASLGCNSCHNSGPNAHGPNLAHIYGARVQLKDGQFVIADSAFLRDTILNPTLHELAGYAPIMPTYQGQVSEEGLIDLVEYIRRLDSQYRIQQTIENSESQPVQTGAAPPGTSAPTMAPGTVKP